MSQLQTIHQVAATPADAIGQWFNAGGMVDFYDYSLETYLEVSSPCEKLSEELMDFAVDDQTR